MAAKVARLLGNVALLLLGFLFFWIATLWVLGFVLGLCYFFAALIEVLAHLVRRACEYLLIKHSEYFLLLVTLLALFFFPAFCRDYLLQEWLRGRKS